MNRCNSSWASLMLNRRNSGPSVASSIAGVIVTTCTSMRMMTTINTTITSIDVDVSVGVGVDMVSRYDARVVAASGFSCSGHYAIGSSDVLITTVTTGIAAITGVDHCSSRVTTHW